MTLTEARKKIKEYTADGIGAYITARIMKNHENPDFILDPNGYRVSDWFDGSCVEYWSNGKNRGFAQ